MFGRRRVSSSSRSGGAVHELTHDWTITGYDFIKGYQIERFNSPTFKFYGFEWFIQFYPHGTTDNRENVAIFLIGKDLPKAEILCSYIQFSVVNQQDDAKTLCPRPYYYVLSGKDTKHNHSNSGGHINVIKSADLHDASRGFIGEDGTLRIHLKLRISCLDPMMCPHARDPRTGECRMSATPESSAMDIRDDSPAQRAGLMPSLQSLLASGVCTDVELRVAVKSEEQPGLDDSVQSPKVKSHRSSFKPFDVSRIPHAPSTLRPHEDHDDVFHAANSRQSFNSNCSLSCRNAPSARNTAEFFASSPPFHSQSRPRSFDADMSLELDTTLDEHEFSASMMSVSLNDSSLFIQHEAKMHHVSSTHSVGDIPAPLSSPPRANTQCSGSLPPPTPSASMAAHAGPTTPAPSSDPETRPRFVRVLQSPRKPQPKTESSKPTLEHFYSRQAHKCILASRSPVFRAMFSLRMRESVSNVVEIEDMRPEVLDALLAYIYSDKEPDLRLAPDMLVVADKYQMPGLLHTCECVLARALTVENCLAALVFAERYTVACPHLRETTTGFVCDHFSLVCRSDSFVDLMRTHTGLAHEVVCENARALAMASGDRHSVYST